MVISDFKVFIVFVALGLPFPQVHLSVGGGGGGGGGNRLTVLVANTSCGISTGPASAYNYVKVLAILPPSHRNIHH